jgi:aminopeptidase N
MSRSVPVLLVSIVLLTLINRLIADSTFPITRRVENVEIRQDDGRRYRLPNNTVPEAYDITLTTRVDNADFIFNGNVRISILATEATSLITLHHRQLTIVDVRLWTITSQEVSVGAFSYNPDLEFLEIPVNVGGLTAGTRYILEINYIGTLREDNNGFYRSSYRNDNGDQIWQAATQFESTNARHGFPCYDEPQLKANFTVTIIHGSAYTALSNMPVSDGYPIVK